MESRTTLKAYFQTGDKPTEAQFASLIDSVPNLVDDIAGYQEIILKTDVTVTSSPQTITILGIDSSSLFLITECWMIILERIGTSADGTKRIQVGHQGNNLILSSGVSADNVGGVPEDLSSALQIICDELPSGITSLKIRVLCRGYKVSKT